MAEQLTAADVLERAAVLIEKPGAWTQGGAARDASGRFVWFASPSATCWCAMGAINLVAEEEVTPSRIMDLMDKVCGEFFEDWNDKPERTQAEVAAKLREAAALARAEAA